MSEPSQEETLAQKAPLDYARPEVRARHRITPWAIVLLILLGLMFSYAMFIRSQQTSRPHSQRVECASNMRQIGLTCIMYSNDDVLGRYPDRLETALRDEDITPEVFVCPSSHDVRAPGPTTQAAIAQLSTGGYLSYVYLGNGVTSRTATADLVILYEPLRNHHNDGMNVMFGDAHVEWFDAKSARVLLTAIIASGGKPVRWDGVRATTVTLPSTQPGSVSAQAR